MLVRLFVTAIFIGLCSGGGDDPPSVPKDNKEPFAVAEPIFRADNEWCADHMLIFNGAKL